MSTNSTNYFTYAEAENLYYEKECKYDDDCPGSAYCDNNCKFIFNCRDKDYYHCLSDKDTKIECTVNEDCLTNNCVDHQCVGRYLVCQIGFGMDDKCGYSINEECSESKECFKGSCINGTCQEYDVARHMGRFILAWSIILGIVGFLLFILCIWALRNCIRSRKNKNKK